MVYKKFRVVCALQVVGIAATLGLFAFVLFRTQLSAALVLLGLVIVYQVYSLLHYVDKTNRDLTRFFESVKYGDFTQTFKDNRSRALGSFAGLHAALAEVVEAFRLARAEKEEQALYLQTVVQHVGIGLLVFQPNGDVDLINKAARRLLKVQGLKNVKALSALSPALVKAFLALRPGEHVLVKADIDDEPLQLSLYAAEFKLRGREFTLVSLQDIRSELEEKEIEAWQKLIRVLTHEIMNSMTPISSLASTAQDLLAQSAGRAAEGAATDLGTIGDIQIALQTIEKRSQGLLRFVDAYRNLARIPKPDFQIFMARELFTRVEQLLQSRFAELRVGLRTELKPSSLELMADPGQLEQVLINLLLNAADAVKEKEGGRVELAACLDDRGRPVIQVRDNGVGIPQENIDKIFVPFFSTKEGGSGIGLSLSRQIMRLHGGSISVSSRTGEETVFTLRFKL